MSLTPRQRELVALLEKDEEEVGSGQCVFRDMLTDMLHIADYMNLDWDYSVESAREVYEQEK